VITDKYIAGLIDSDGYLGFNIKKRADGSFRVGPRVSIKQRQDRSQVLYDIAAEWDIQVYDDANTHCIVFTGNKANRILERIQKHLVIKPDVAKFILESTPTECSEEELKDLKNAFNVVRRTTPEREHNYPSRRWLAGYFDGDGSLQCDKKGNLKLQFTSHEREQAALKLIHKAFGGSLHVSGNVAKLYIYLPYRYSKNHIDSVLGYFGKHSVIKQSQVQFVLGHAGRVSTSEIYNKLKQLKSPASTKRDASL
jgi:hypothetical protein